ncbi:hypothetical protein BU25DRAFT_424913 [Macroventuria anomochaeta]|uniref:Uncharacterized protein n=1 Tax=Macroventuria anomochaeta TaxID=301207 RepID=A0ACB6RQH1_9PLEO|nr:uncharacterized protein BU25DRAFT_424913 [Macroventuria anomochaeta]KAF2623399.1 hypothetical protein BU25DRAFT_424913 [Macroventuria anomochaeta]
MCISTGTHLGDAVADGLAGTLDQFPEPTAYTFAIPGNKGYIQDRKLLSLSETDSFQAWARLKAYPHKPDEVEHVDVSFLSDTSMAAYNLSHLPINMYPFNLVAEKNSNAMKEKLTVLIRYVFRKAASINQPFSLEAKQTFRNVLVGIQKDIEAARGADKLLNTHPPNRLPKSLSYVDALLIGKTAGGANVIIDQ